MKDLFKIGATIFLTGFGLNLVWEVIQTILFFDFPFRGQVRLFAVIHLRASAGDATYIVLIYLLVVVLTWNSKWLQHLTWFRAAAALLAGFLIAVHIEQRALETGRWSYGQLMPLLPYLQVGLMPVLQMMILPMVTYIISKKLLGLDCQARPSSKDS